MNKIYRLQLCSRIQSNKKHRSDAASSLLSDFLLHINCQ